MTCELKSIVDALSSLEHNVMNHYGNEAVPYPSEEELKEIVDLSRAVLFPGFYGRRVPVQEREQLQRLAHGPIASRPAGALRPLLRPPARGFLERA